MIFKILKFAVSNNYELNKTDHHLSLFIKPMRSIKPDNFERAFKSS